MLYGAPVLMACWLQPCVLACLISPALPPPPCLLQELRAERARLVETLETLAAQVRVAVIVCGSCSEGACACHPTQQPVAG